jgi:UDP-N-acetylglucosamine 2-epimerase (hydrolysing)
MKKIVFVTGTRADYGKLKSIILKLERIKNFKVSVFVTGMHNLKIYGSTHDELRKDKIKNIVRFKNQNNNDSMDSIISKTINGFRKYVLKENPDLVVVHGDRVESLACAIVASINNIKAAHIEGGELSGTIDEVLRHSISKLCNLHFVTNNIAKKRLIQMGELRSSIFVIGSPDVDLILKKDLPSIREVREKYDIKFLNYAVAIFHPVTNELINLKKEIKIFLKSITESKQNFVLIFPNNDSGTNIILNEYKKIKSDKIKIFPSIRFEYYLSLLKNSNFIIGNSSSGIMEAPYYGVPTINLGNRQLNRVKLKSIINLGFNKKNISKLIKYFSKNNKKFKKTTFFGEGHSAKKFINIIKKKNFWNIKNQKQFNEISIK